MHNKKLFATVGKVAAVTLAAVLLTSANATPAGACEQPVAAPTAVVSTADTVRVTQLAPGTGSGAGRLEWPVVAGATEYRVYKTGSIRPYWRLFWIAPATVNSRTVVDRPGAIAIYRVVSVVNGREIAIGRFIYRPVK